MASCGLKSSGAGFRSKLAGAPDDLGCRPSCADPDVWLKAATKPDRFICYEMVLVCVDDVMVISHVPGKTIEGVSNAFKLKGNKASPPAMCLGASLEPKVNSAGAKCWSISPEKYVAASVSNIEEKLAKEGQRLPSECPTPMSGEHHPSDDTSEELTSDGVKLYQECIGVL
jgi:hypothetical protein